MIIRNASEYSDSGLGGRDNNTAAHLTRTSHKKAKNNNNNKDSSNFNNDIEEQNHFRHQNVV